MSLTVLFDLDDTLLVNDIDTFLPLYLRALGKHMIDYRAPDLLIQDLLAGTLAMQANDTPARTLEATFDDVFYPAIGYEKTAMRQPLDDFYANPYSALQTATRPVEGAAELIRAAKERGYTLVLATNPLFPASAIRQRIEWAGLNPGDFALITTYEQMHFSKPNPAYVAEILAQLGWPERPAVMIGNSLQDDLLPAAVLGLPVYWVTPAPEQEAAAAAVAAGLPRMVGSGSLMGVLPWLERIAANPAEALSALPVDGDDAATSARAPVRSAPNVAPTALLAMLKATAAAVDTLSTQIGAAEWQRRPAPGAWNALEVVHHLNDVEQEINLPRVETLLAQENPFIAGVDADIWAAERGYAQRDPSPAVQGFVQARTRLVDHLRGLDEAGWQRPARHAIFGPTTLQELLGFTLTHDRVHLHQLWQAAC